MTVDLSAEAAFLSLLFPKLIIKMATLKKYDSKDKKPIEKYPKDL